MLIKAKWTRFVINPAQAHFDPPLTTLWQFRKHHPKVHGLEYIDEALKGVSFRHTIKASHETAVDLKGPLGLNRLHTSSEALIDLIFVHGLGGGSRKTWSKSEGAYHYWPKELLPRDPNFKNVRIFSFGYRADWAERNGNALDVNDFAQSLLGEINTCSEIRRINVRSLKLIPNIKLSTSR